MASTFAMHYQQPPTFHTTAQPVPIPGACRLPPLPPQHNHLQQHQPTYQQQQQQQHFSQHRQQPQAHVPPAAGPFLTPSTTPPTSQQQQSNHSQCSSSLGPLSDSFEFGDVTEEYGLEIAQFMRELEEKTLPSPHLMSIQTDINWKMRKTLILWLIDVHREYRLRQETLYLTINILDRVCSKRAFARYQFQLLGITSLWVAAKYEENHGKVPSLKALCFVCCDTYRERDFLAMEKVILKEIQFELGHPTPEAFLKANCRFLKSIEEDGRCLARYIMENTLVHRRFLGVRPSLIATASLMLAERILGRNGWFYDDPKLIDCMAQMADCMRQPPNQLFIKYADTSLLSVSRLAQTWTEIHTRPMNPYDPNTGLLTPPKEISLQNLLPFKETKPPTFTLLQASSAPLQPSHITAATGTTGAPPSVSANAAAAAAAAEALSSLHFWDLHAGRGMGQHFSLPSMIRAVWE